MVTADGRLGADWALLRKLLPGSDRVDANVGNLTKVDCRVLLLLERTLLLLPTLPLLCLLRDGRWSAKVDTASLALLRFGTLTLILLVLGTIGGSVFDSARCPLPGCDSGSRFLLLSCPTLSASAPPERALSRTAANGCSDRDRSEVDA